MSTLLNNTSRKLLAINVVAIKITRGHIK